MENDAVPQGAEPTIERRLSTILMADVAGYSRMMGENEERTVQVLRGHRQVFEEMLRLHRGRIFNTAGDAVLAEFPSAVEAVRCATETQTALRTRNEHLTPAERMWFRIGINLGDVIVQGGDLLGDGVNVAARIQSIADPGGVCISGSVYDQIQNKLTLQIKQLGEKNFKNIAQPIRTFSISDDGDGSRRAGMARWRPSRSGPIVATAIGMVVLIAVAGAGYWLYRDYEARMGEEARRAQEAQRAAEAQRKAEQDKAAAAASQHEAKLLSELQGARDALNQAEASKRKAEQERMIAETAQREAKLQGELKAAKDALQRAEASERKADEERKAAAAAMRVAETAVQKAPEPQPKVETKAEPKVVAAAASPAPPASQGIDRFDGRYPGRMCTQKALDTTDLRCWPVELTVKSGTFSGSWFSQNSGKQTYAKGTIAADGRVETSIDAYNAKGRPMNATLKGAWNNETITVSGTWLNALPARGAWTRAQ